MKMKKNKLVNLFKMGLLLFGMSVLLLNCEKENGIEPQEITSQNRFEKSFNKDDFKKTIPFSYEVNWEGIVKKYSEELETNFYEFDLIYDTPFNPTTINNLKKEGYNISYKLIVTESEENKLDFFVAKFFQKKDGVTKIEDLNISLNKNSDYEGFTHLYDTNNELYFAKKINEKEIKEPKLYFKDKVKEDNSGLYARGDVTTCTTSTLYHYIDWYRYTYDAWGNVISIVYLYTEYVGSSSTTSCITEFQPDEPIRIIRGEGDGYLDCLDGSGRRNCAKAAEPRIMCQVGFQPDENGDCVEVKKLSLDDSLDDSFAFSDTLGLTDEQENWINDERNKEAKDAITNYLNSFAFTPEFENAKGFSLDAIIFLIQNSKYNFLQYENWFSQFNAEIETSPTVVDPDLITFDALLTQQSLPAFNTFLTNFPKIGNSGNYSPMSTTDAYTLVGRSLLNSHINQRSQYNNACAIRASRGLLYSGIQIPVLRYNGSQRTQKGGDGKNYILDAVSFNTYMIAKFGETSAKLEGADANDPVKVAALLNGKNGIYVIVNSNTTAAGYSGHCDLIINGKTISVAYTSPSGGVKSIRIWQLN